MKYKTYVFCPLAPSAEVVYPRSLSRHSWSCKMHVFKMRMVRTSLWGGQRAPSNLSSASSLSLYTIMGLKWLDSWVLGTILIRLCQHSFWFETTDTHWNIFPSHPDGGSFWIALKWLFFFCLFSPAWRFAYTVHLLLKSCC